MHTNRKIRFIIARDKKGETPSAIARHFKMPRSTVRTILKRAKKAKPTRAQLHQLHRRAVKESVRRLLVVTKTRSYRRWVVSYEEVRDYIVEHCATFQLTTKQLPKRTALSALIREIPVKARTRARKFIRKVENTGITDDQMRGLQYHARGW